MYEMERLEARLSKEKTEGRTEEEEEKRNRNRKRERYDRRTLKRMKQIKEQKT